MSVVLMGWYLRYEFAEINSREFSNLRIRWYQSRMTEAMELQRYNSAVLHLDEPVHMKADGFKPEVLSPDMGSCCSPSSHLSTEVEGDLDEGERFYLKSVEVPDDLCT